MQVLIVFRIVVCRVHQLTCTNASYDLDQIPHHLRLPMTQLRQIPNMFPRNDERMTSSDGQDIQKRHYVRRRVDNVSLRRAVDDAAKGAVSAIVWVEQRRVAEGVEGVVGHAVKACGRSVSAGRDGGTCTEAANVNAL